MNTPATRALSSLLILPRKHEKAVDTPVPAVYTRNTSEPEHKTVRVVHHKE